MTYSRSVGARKADEEEGQIMTVRNREA